MGKIVFPVWRTAAVALAALSLVLLNGHPPRRDAGSGPYTAALARFLSRVGRDHAVEGRLSGGLPPGNGSSTRNPRLATLLAAIERDAARNRRPRELGALAVWRTLSGRQGLASAAFEEALGSAPADARLHNDLAVSLLLASRERGPFELLMRALEEVEKATETNPAIVEAAFNRALLLEEMGLSQSTARAWRSYLARDADSPWAAVARAHLESLQSPDVGTAVDEWKTALDPGLAARLGALVRRSPETARLRLQDELLPRWGAALRDGKGAEAIRALEAADRLADVLASLTHDLLPRAAVDQLRDGNGASRLSRLSTEAAGFVAYGEARREWSSSRPASALSLFAKAERDLSAAGNPFSVAARYGMAAAAYEEKKLAEAERLLPDVLERARRGRYGFVLGRGLWLQAMVELETGRPEQSVLHLQEAQEIFARANEPDHSLQVATRLANALGYLGATARAWEVRGRSLRSIRPTTSPVAVREALAGAARAATQGGYYAAGLAFQGEQLERMGHDAIGRAEGYRRQALLHARRGSQSLAEADIQRALRECERIEDPGLARHVRAGILAVFGSIAVSHRPEAAIAALSESERIYRASGFAYSRGEILLDRSRALRALGRPAEGDRDLLAALAEFERQRALVGSLPLQIGFFDRAREVIEDLVAARVREGEPRRALEVLERGRARGLLRAFSRGSTSPEPLSPLPFRDTAVIEYLVTPTHTYAWMLRGATSRFHDVRIDRPRLEDVVVACRSALRTAGPVGAAGCRELRTLLVEPLASGLAGARDLVFVPDGPLHAVPFAALPDEAGRPLIDRFSVANSPSAAVYIGIASKTERLPAIDSWTVLAMGDPAFDRRRNPDLPRLPGAGREAAAVAALFPGSQLLTGASATAAGFLGGLGQRTIVHFAGHAIANHDRPERSRLLVAAGTDGRDSLEAAEIAERDGGATKLVVLSACDTALGGSSLEGNTSLALPFLTAGVPAVIGGLWPVDDRAAEHFWPLFYDELRRSRSAAWALRAAQLRMIAGGDEFSRPSAWAAFQLTGGLPPSRGEESNR